ncbi:MAG: hypothetical protein HC915_16245 [Anaerolineae bacterium]|nr:hypothetical protein [Anaerolineae bacterium]
MTSMNNATIASVFEDVADLLQIKGEIIHRVLAYRNAAEVVRDLPRELSALHAEGTLTAIDGIGPTLAEKIEEMLATGKLAFYERLAAEVPVTLLDVLRINGVGPKKAKLFWDELGITTLDGLEAAAREGKLSPLKGMGAKSEAKILAGIEALRRYQGRTPIGVALPAALAILNDLLSVPGACAAISPGACAAFARPLAILTC